MKITTKTYHHPVEFLQNSSIYEWEQLTDFNFDELIVTWNAQRPLQGELTFSISIKLEEWSEWLPYAKWGEKGQSGGDSQTTDCVVMQDICEIKNGKLASAFRLSIKAEHGAKIQSLHYLHVCITQRANHEEIIENIPPKFVELKVPLISQMLLIHSRHRDLCSPTSTSCVINYLLKSTLIDPIDFSVKARDDNFDIMGNWVLNCAEAYTYLKNEWLCWVQRGISFNDIYSSLWLDCPVVVSVRHPLKGSAIPYIKGHLIVIKGYDPLKKQVLCMDPAFTMNEATDVRYDLQDFLEAWKRRGMIMYLFKKKDSL